MKKIIVMMRHTVRSLYEQRLIGGLLALAALFLVIVSVMGHFRTEEQVKMLQDMGVTFFSAYAFLIILLIVPNLFHTEYPDTTDLIFFTKPVRRTSIVLGKFLGVLWFFLLTLITGTAFFLLILFMRFHVWNPVLLKMIYLLVLKYVLFLAVMFFLSSCMHRTLAFFCGIAVFVLANMGAFLYAPDHPGKAAAGISVFQIAALTVLPRFDFFSVTDALLLGRTIPFSYLALVTGYTALYGGCTLFLAIAIWNRKEL